LLPLMISNQLSAKPNKPTHKKIFQKNPASVSSRKLNLKSLNSPIKINKQVGGITFQSKLYAIQIVNGAGEDFHFHNEVPHKEGNIYGWALQIKDNIKKIELEEVIIAPAKTTWSYDYNGKTNTVSGKKVSILKNFEVKGNVVLSEWTVSKADPKGEYIFKIYYKDILVTEFKFIIDDL